MTNETPTAGPDWVCATTPVTTKMPAPMMTPTPKTVRSSPDRLFLSRCSGSSVSRIESSTDLTRRIPAATASPFVDRLRGPARRRADPLPGSVARVPDRRMPTLTGSAEPPRASGGGTPMSTSDGPATPAPLPIPPSPLADHSPAPRPRPAGRRRQAPTRARDKGPVVDCAVYVDGNRQAPVAPEEALR